MSGSGGRWAGALATGAATLAVTVLLSGGAVAHAAGLPRCADVLTGRVVPVGAQVRATVTTFYARQHLTPVTFVKNRETIVKVAWQWPGVRHCTNPGGGQGAYVGHVPKNATAAVLVMVTHKPYPVTQAATHFLMVARIPAKGWRVVSEGTGP